MIQSKKSLEEIINAAEGKSLFNFLKIEEILRELNDIIEIENSS